MTSRLTLNILAMRLRTFVKTSRVSRVSRGQISNGAEATANVGEPSEREALLTILLSMPARECLVVILLWGARELVVLLPAEGWSYLYVWTVCPCIYAYVI
jgi:hypothetical protein